MPSQKTKRCQQINVSQLVLTLTSLRLLSATLGCEETPLTGVEHDKKSTSCEPADKSS